MSMKKTQQNSAVHTEECLIDRVIENMEFLRWQIQWLAIQTALLPVYDVK